MHQLLEECDEKIKHLGDLNIKWTEFNKNLGDLKVCKMLEFLCNFFRRLFYTEK